VFLAREKRGAKHRDNYTFHHKLTTFLPAENTPKIEISQQNLLFHPQNLIPKCLQIFLFSADERGR
jgi:hypothetical protein